MVTYRISLPDMGLAYRITAGLTGFAAFGAGLVVNRCTGGVGHFRNGVEFELARE